MTEFETQLLNEMRAIRVAIDRIAGFAPNGTAPVVANEQHAAKQSAAVPAMTPQPSASAPTSPASVPTPKSIDHVEYLYFGTPDGQGFDECNVMYDPNNPRVLYVIESIGIKGRFYPLGRGLSRLRSNASTFLLPLCNLSVPLDELQSLAVSPDNYGEVELKDGFWHVTKKCNI